MQRAVFTDGHMTGSNNETLIQCGIYSAGLVSLLDQGSMHTHLRQGLAGQQRASALGSSKRHDAVCQQGQEHVALGKQHVPAALHDGLSTPTQWSDTHYPRLLCQWERSCGGDCSVQRTPRYTRICLRADLPNLTVQQANCTFRTIIVRVRVHPLYHAQLLPPTYCFVEKGLYARHLHGVRVLCSSIPW